MNANPHLAAQLDDFAKLESPGFALMITAPWGAGKTHAIKKWLGDRDHLYVSLFGIDSLAGVEEALFEAVLEAKQKTGQGKSLAKSIDGAARIVQGAIKAKTGVTFDATGLVRKAVLADAPRLLVLDDLERAQLDPPRLLSIINRFVEHEGKTVLLLANEDELERAKGQPDSGEAKSDYRRWREKVVGRTITLRPDTQAALDSFFAAIVDEGARTALANRREAILDVFARSETANLRLLRQSLIECGRFLTKVPEVYRRQDRALTSLIGDFLALSIDWHAGDRLTIGDFDYHAESYRRLRARDNPNAASSGLEKLRKRHAASPDVDLDGRFLPDMLASKVIVEGHATDDEIDILMRRADGFRHDLQEDAWRTLWWWHAREEEAVITAYGHVRSQIAETAFVEPEIILHVWGILLGLAEDGLFDLRVEDVVSEALTYLDKLTTEGRLQVPDGSARIDRRFGDEASHGLSYHSRDTSEFARIRDALRAALVKTREMDAPQELRELLDNLKENPDRFWLALNGGDKIKRIPNLMERQVFLAAEPSAVATEVFALPHVCWRGFLIPMKERQLHLDVIAGLDGGAPNGERQWLRAFREHARALADESSDFRKAQILWFVEGFLSFLDEEVGTPNS